MKDKFNDALYEFARNMTAARDRRGLPAGFIPSTVMIACTTCSDIHFLNTTTSGGERPPVGHPLFGQIYPCPDCNVRDRVDADFGLMSGDIQRLDWDVVKPIQANRTGMDAAVAALKIVIAQGSGWVYLHGGYGKGKTLLLEIVTALSLRAGRQAQYLTATDMMDNLRSAFDKESTDQTLADRINGWKHIDVLCLDEVTRESATNFTTERLFQILDHRYRTASSRQASGITIIAANVSPDKLNDPALTDRILDEQFAVVDMDNPGSLSARRISRSLK